MNVTHRLATRQFQLFVAQSFIMFCLASPISAQGIVWEVLSQGQNESFGGSMDGVANVGDVNIDGIDDVAIGSPSAKLGTLQYVGKITIYSGKDGTILKTVWGSGANASLGMSVGRVVDFTNDGIDELIGSGFPFAVGTTVFLGGGDAVLIDGLSGLNSCASLGDFTGDGIPEFCVGGYGNPYPKTTCYNGATKAVIWSFIYPYMVFRSTTMDFDGDGIGDIAGNNGGGLEGTSPGAAWVFSGKTGAPILTFQDTWTGVSWSKIGWALALPGDINADGVPDLAITNKLASDGGKVHFYSGKDKSEFGVAKGYSLTCVAVGDLDGDGVGDVIAQGNAGNIFAAISGRTFAVMFQFGYAQPYLFGGDGMGDVNGDDFPDFILAGAQYLNNYGKAIMYSGAATGISTFGAGCPGDDDLVPRIGCTGSARIGKPFPINLCRVAPGARAWLVVGNTSTLTNDPNLPIDFGGYGAPNCALIVSPDQIYPIATHSTGAGNGAATVDLAINNDPLLVGTAHYAQWIVSNTHAATPLSVTRGLAFIIQQ